jgi:hypothetical protein
MEITEAFTFYTRRRQKMKNRYPWISLTLMTGFMFVGFYILTLVVISLSYNFYFDRPADQSREISAVYYGLAFSIVPYLPLGWMLYAYVRERRILLTLHGVGIGMLIEKVAFVYLGTLLGTGYPWYGRGFPQSGYVVLCEELPMFCRTDYVLHYYLWGPLLAFGAFYSGTKLVRLGRSKELSP